MLAYKDRRNIICLFIELLKRLAIAGGTTAQIYMEENYGYNDGLCCQKSKYLRYCAVYIFVKTLTKKCIESTSEGDDKTHLKQ